MSKRVNKEHWSGYSKKYFMELVDEEQNTFISQIPQYSATTSSDSGVLERNTFISQIPLDSSTTPSNSAHSDITEEEDPIMATPSNECTEQVWEELLCEIEESLECIHQTECTGSDSTKLPKSSAKIDLASDLANFAVRKGRPISDTMELLHILNRHKIKDLPKTRGTLLKTPNEKIEQRILTGGGTYYYRGIRKSLEVRKHLLTNLESIEIDVGIDGARAFKSSRLDLWPCIAAISDLVQIRPFLLDLFQSQQNHTMQHNFFHPPTSVPTNSQPYKKPIFITLKKTGNNFILAKAQATNFPTKNTLRANEHEKLNGFDVKGENIGVKPKTPIQYFPNHNQANAGVRKLNGGSHSRLPIQSESKNVASKSYGPVSMSFINEKKTINHLPVSDKTSSSSKTLTISSDSKAISKQKPAKRTYKKKQPNELSKIPKYHFPPPPPKIDFTVSTNTIFNTTIDESTEEEKPASDTSMLSIRNESTVDQSNNGVPSDCRTLKKILVEISKDKACEAVAAISVTSPKSSNVLRRPDVAPISSESGASASFLDLQQLVVNENADYYADQPVAKPVVETISSTTEYGHILERLDRMEALQLASAKRDAQLLVAIKKLCLQYTKHNNDNKEIKKLLPIKEETVLIEIDTRIIEDPVFKEKLIAYLRGFKTTNDPENFTAFFNVLLADELVDKFNLKGVMGKMKLEGFKIMEIIQVGRIRRTYSVSIETPIIPTLIRWNGPQRLEGEQLLNPELLSMFFSKE